MKSMVVLGVGTFGSSIARKAAKLGVHVTVIDRKTEALESIKDMVAEARIIDLSDERAVKENLSKDYDTAVIAMHQDFSCVLLLVIYLKEIGMPHIIARAETFTQMDVLVRLGVEEVILPEHEMGKRVAERLVLNRSEHLPLTDDEGIVHIPVPAKLIGTTIGDFVSNDKYHVKLVFVRREYIDNKLSRLIEATEKDVELTSDDYLVLLGRTRRITKFIDSFS